MGKSNEAAISNNKTLDIAVDAIQTLKELPGSTSKDIINYITKNYPIDKDTTRKQIQGSLKRGIAYGILIRKGGRYSLPIESDAAAGEEIAKQEIGLIEMCRRRKRGRRKKAQKKSSRESGALRRRCCSNKHCSCSGNFTRRVGCNNKRKKPIRDQHQNLRSADSCCCIRYNKFQRANQPRRCTNNRGEGRNADGSAAGYYRRKSSRLQRKNKRDPRFD